MHALVTGGNGHLGFNLVLALLSAGHRVRASVRSLVDTAKTAPLRALGSVELVEAELHQRARLRAAMDGVDTLFHAAAVYSTAEPWREHEILDAALTGTDHTLRAAADAGVRKLVYTSSVVTLPLTLPGAPPSTEADWNDALDVPYVRAKVQAERLAWRLAGELGLNLVSVLPGGIIGPGFHRPTPTIDLIDGAMRGYFRLGAPDANFSYVDARDAADAHLRAAERDAQGRFVACYDTQPSFVELVRMLHRIDPRIGLPLATLPHALAPAYPLVDRVMHAVLGTPMLVTPEVVRTALGQRIWNLSAARAHTELGWRARVSIEQSLRETMAQIRALRG